MKIGNVLLPLAAAFLMAVSSAAAPAADDDAAFGERVHAWLLAHPEVLIEMSQALEAKDNAQKQTALKSFASRLFDDPRDPSAGPKKAKITIALFQDYQCGHCKLEAMPAVFELLKKYPDLRIVFKELPIFGAKSQAAARAAIAASHQGKYLPAFKALMADRQLDDASIEAALKSAGVDVARARADESAKATEALITDTSALAHEIGIEGTPTFVIGGRLVVGADIEAIEAAIAEQRKAK